VGYLLPLLMSAAVVLTGNHFVLDVVTGLALALASLWAAGTVDRRWRHPDAPRRLTPAVPR
jgi:membrane-associated phospholipid phosphatase